MCLKINFSQSLKCELAVKQHLADFITHPDGPKMSEHGKGLNDLKFSPMNFRKNVKCWFAIRATAEVAES